MKKYLIVVMIASLFFTSGCGCSKKNTNNDDKPTNELTTVEKVIAAKEIDGIVLETHLIKDDNGTTSVLTMITNSKTEEFLLQNYELSLVRGDGDTLVIVDAPNVVIMPSEVKSYNVVLDMDVLDYDNTIYRLNIENNMNQ